jgi:hypothetical protein
MEPHRSQIVQLVKVSLENRLTTTQTLSRNNEPLPNLGEWWYIRFCGASRALSSVIYSSVQNYRFTLLQKLVWLFLMAPWYAWKNILYDYMYSSMLYPNIKLDLLDATFELETSQWLLKHLLFCLFKIETESLRLVSSSVHSYLWVSYKTGLDNPWVPL